MRSNSWATYRNTISKMFSGCYLSERARACCLAQLLGYTFFGGNLYEKICGPSNERDRDW